MKEHESPLETPIELPQGLLGLPDHQRFTLVAGAREGFYWLQSVEESGLAFVLMDPFPRFHEYSVDVGAEEQRDLGPFERSELLVLTIVTLGDGETTPTTTNLRGPIVFNLRTRRAKQLVLSDSHVDHRAAFDPAPEISVAV